jgi:aromatic ring-opening dioxygenase catalytic subunit (LigB family)
MINSDNPQRKAQIVYFSHGGGPLPMLGDKGHRAMVEFMRQLSSRLKRPEAILVVSAHWEERVATLLGAQKPVMLYDYNGFPDEAYEIVYPAPGNPQLAERIVRLLHENNIQGRVDTQRGFDHGVFIPLKLMYPEADIPALQLSLLSGLDPVAHISLGQGLRELLPENILVIGSGFSFHNMSAFSRHDTIFSDLENDRFQDWLINVCTSSLSQAEREQLLIDWLKAPAARYCHPREEHLLPLHVCLAMAGKTAELIFDDYILGKRGVAFQW